MSSADLGRVTPPSRRFVTAGPASLKSRFADVPVARRRRQLGEWLPMLVLAPTLTVTFVYVLVFYVLVFCGWTVWISLSHSTLLPDYSLRSTPGCAESIMLVCYIRFALPS